MPPFGRLPPKIGRLFQTPAPRPAPFSFEIPQPVHGYTRFQGGHSFRPNVGSALHLDCANGHWASGLLQGLTPFSSFLHLRRFQGEEGVMDIKTNVQMLAAIASFAVLAAVVCGLV